MKLEERKMANSVCRIVDTGLSEQRKDRKEAEEQAAVT
jgi:hypothetical protein